MSNEIGLGEFIAKVKEDLKPTEDSPIFFLEKAELEIHVTASQEVAGKGEAKGKTDLKLNVLGFDVLKLGEGEIVGGASGKLQRQDVHTIKVTLTPILSKEEIKSTLSKKELDEVTKNSKKLFRGEQEEKKPSLSEGKPKKIMRG